MKTIFTPTDRVSHLLKTMFSMPMRVDDNGWVWMEDKDYTRAQTTFPFVFLSGMACCALNDAYTSIFQHWKTL
jgi:hypothetical protein